MPWIELQLDDPRGGEPIAIELAAAVADALALEREDVLVAVHGRAVVVDGRGPVTGWPAATLHGRRRDPESMARAQRAVVEVLAAGLAVERDRIWVHWCTG